MLLTESRFSGYSHAKTLKDQVVDEMNFNNETDVTERKKKKKKRKRCNSNEKQTENVTLAESNEAPLLSNYEVIKDDSVTINEEKVSRKAKKSKRKSRSTIETIPEDEELVVEPKKDNDKTKKKKEKMVDL